MRLTKIKLIFLLLLPVLVALTVYTTRLKTDISAFFIAGDNAEELLLANEIQSGALSRRTILSIGRSDQQPVSPQFVQTFIASLKTIPGVAAVWKVGEMQAASKALTTLYRQYGAQLYSRNPEHDLPELLTEQNLALRASALKQALLSPQSALVKKIAAYDPLLLALNGFKEPFAALQNNREDTQRYQNLILETVNSGMDAATQSRVQQAIIQQFDQISAQMAESSHYQLDMTGVPVFAAATQGMIEADVKFVSSLSTVILSLLFFWIFRSISVFFWISCLLISVVALAILMTNLVFGEIHGMALAIGGTLVGICVDYPIHALVHAQAVDASKRIQAIATIWPSLLLGGITTLIGYFALGVSGYPGFQQVAVFAGSGILSALLLTRYLLPHLIDGMVENNRSFKFTGLWIRFCRRFRGLLLVLVSVLFGLSLMALSSLTWLEDLQQLTPELDYLKVKDAEIRARMLSIEPGRFILVSAPEVETALQHAEQVYQILDQLKAQGHLEGYFGLYPWLLSQKQQTHNAQLLNQQLSLEVRKSWQKALISEKLSVSHLGQLTYPLEPVLTAAQVLQSPIGHLLENQLLIKPQETLIMIWLTEHQPEILQNSLANIPHVQYFSQRDLLNSMTKTYQQHAETMLLAGLSVIMLVLFYRYRNLLKALQTLAPALLSMVIVLGVWSYSGLPLSFLHLIGFLLVIAICADYGIFYQENPGSDINLTYQSIAASMLTSVGAFSCLAFAQTSTLKTLAEIVSCGLVLGFLLCPIMIKQTRK